MSLHTDEQYIKLALLYVPRCSSPNTKKNIELAKGKANSRRKEQKILRLFSCKCSLYTMLSTMHIATHVTLYPLHELFVFCIGLCM